MRSLPEGLRPPVYPCWSSLTGFSGVFGCRFPSRSQGRCFSALSESLDVSVLLAQYRYLVLEQNGVQSHLRMDQGHRAKPAGKFVHARLPLGKVVRVCPTRRPGRLQRREGQCKHFRNVLLALWLYWFHSFCTCPIIVSLYCFFWVTLIGGILVTADTRKFMRMSSQFESWSTIVFKLPGR